MSLYLVARITIVLAPIVLIVGSILAIVTGAPPSPGLPPFLVEGEDLTTGIGVSHILPIVLGLTWILSVPSLVLIGKKMHLVLWLYILSATWGIVWLTWNFIPAIMFVTSALLLLALNVIAIYGASRIILGVSGWRLDNDSAKEFHAAVRSMHQKPRQTQRAGLPVVYALVGVIVMGGIIASPNMARLVVKQPHGIITTLAIHGPVAVDSGMVAMAPDLSRVVILLGASYIQLFDVRVIDGTAITMDSRHDTILKLYP